MRELFLYAILILTISTQAYSENYIIGKNKAKKLLHEKKTEEAFTAFEELAAGKVTDRQKADALSYAINCGISLKKFDKCKELAELIPIKDIKILKILQILDRTRKRKEAIDKFKDIDVEKLIELVRGDVYYQRGLAYMFLQDYENAKKDLEAALNYLNDKNTRPMTVNHLANIYFRHDKDAEKAIETYRKVYTMGHMYKAASAATGIAAIYKSQQKYDEALAELEKIDEKVMKHPIYKMNADFARAQIMEKMGKNEEAISAYKKLQEMKTPPYMKKLVKKSLIDLGAITPE
ncbi:MAG: tetratricopeptide repeat protein [Planctomycetota bacterium]|jgi:tetratricopeptide (TPR) repeat protein